MIDVEKIEKALEGFQSIANFARDYQTRRGTKGVTRAYIYQQRDKERNDPGVTGLEFIEVDGSLFVRRKDYVDPRKLVTT
ncbi:MAG: hypothetical protein QM762_12475 [Chryseolinea sp.]